MNDDDVLYDARGDVARGDVAHHLARARCRQHLEPLLWSQPLIANPVINLVSQRLAKFATDREQPIKRRHDDRDFVRAHRSDETFKLLM